MMGMNAMRGLAAIILSFGFMLAVPASAAVTKGDITGDSLVDTRDVRLFYNIYDTVRPDSNLAGGTLIDFEDGTVIGRYYGDITAPADLAGLAAYDAYDGRVNLKWDSTTTSDFAYYRIYVSDTALTDVTDTPVRATVTSRTQDTYSITGIDTGVVRYFAVTAVDTTGNEDTGVTWVSLNCTSMVRAGVDSRIVLDTYDATRCYGGSTFLYEGSDTLHPRIVEVNMYGEVIWQYFLPNSIKPTFGATDVEFLDSGTLLFNSSGKGLYELSRATSDTVWQYIDRNNSHDVDRLSNGNTLYSFGNNDTSASVQVREINPSGTTVFSWSAYSVYSGSFADTFFDAGYAHTNAVSRLADGNTLVSLRNFNRSAIVASNGSLVRDINYASISTADDPHDPEPQPNGNFIVCLQNSTTESQVVEYDSVTLTKKWDYFRSGLRTVRDANRLPNGNTLILGVLTSGDKSVIFEVTPDRQIVWQIAIPTPSAAGQPGWFFKCERVSPLYQRVSKEFK